jgi:hypothetical protein
VKNIQCVPKVLTKFKIQLRIINCKEKRETTFMDTYTTFILHTLNELPCGCHVSHG